MRFGRRRREPGRVDVTPLIDIIFQLVIFFMVSTSFVSTPGIDVKLPRSTSNVLLDRHDLDVWMTAEGAVYLDHRPVSWEELERAFRQAAARDASTLVVIRADEHVEHGDVVAVMDLARRSGLDRLAIATEGRRREAGGR